MTTPTPPISDAERVERVRQDGEDRRFAAMHSLGFGSHDPLGGSWQTKADEIYAYLRQRATTQPAGLEVQAGTPQPEGAPPS